MEAQAYDVKLLVEKLKAQGLEIAEESAKVVAEALFDWIEESAKISKSPYDDMALLVMPHLKKLAMDNIEKINKAD